MRLFIVVCYGCRQALDLQHDAYVKLTGEDGTVRHFHNNREAENCWNEYWANLQKMRRGRIESHAKEVSAS